MEKSESWLQYMAHLYFKLEMREMWCKSSYEIFLGLDSLGRVKKYLFFISVTFFLQKD